LVRLAPIRVRPLAAAEKVEVIMGPGDVMVAG
jgi:hypothetical protein